MPHKRIFQSLALSLAFFFTCLIFSSNSYSALIDVQQKNNIVYFLFAAPNKIARYDLDNKKFITKITLNKVPSAFKVNDTSIYIAYNTELKELDLKGIENSLIHTFDRKITSISSTTDNIFLSTENNSYLLDINDYSLVENVHGFHNASSLISSTKHSAFYYRSESHFGNNFFQLSLPEKYRQGFGTYNAHQGQDNAASKIYINPTEDYIVDDSGLIFNTSNNQFAGSFGNHLDHLTFINDKTITLHQNTLSLYDANHHDIGHYNLNHNANYVAAKDEIITTFSTTNSLVSSQQIALNLLTQNTASQPKKPDNIHYESTLIAHDDNNIIYLIDAKSLAVYRRNISENKYEISWGLLEAPSWITYSSNHERLYLAYESGRITYFDVTQGDMAIEKHHITLPKSIGGLLATENYLYANDSGQSSAFHYGINKSGKISNILNVFRNTTAHAWSLNKGNIHFLDSNRFQKLNISQADGILTTTRTVSQGNELKKFSPLFLSPDGEILLNASGQILEADDYTILNTLDNNINDAIWIKDTLVTTSKENSTLQFWQEDYLLASQYFINNTEDVRLFSLKEKLLILHQSDKTPPTFSVYDLSNIPDTDKDTIHDLADNCVDISNTTQKDSDSDYIGDACDLDNDNDLIPDTVENSAGLDPKNANDALLDLDNDGFSNLAEYANNTDINNINSRPAAVSEFMINLDSGMPVGFYKTSPKNSWSIKKTTHENADNINVLASGFVQKKGDSSSIFYTADFNNGILSFDYQMSYLIYHNYKVDFFIDDKPAQYMHNSRNKNSHKTKIEAGIHTLAFKLSLESRDAPHSMAQLLINNLSFTADSDADGHGDNEDNCPMIQNEYQQDSDNDGKGDLCDNDPYGQDRDGDGYGDHKDNCPEIYNPTQADSDNDRQGDACDTTDNRPLDSDNDSVEDNYDNCPFTPNSDQHDLDNDRIGNACDADIDNDGLSNEIEDQYTFLNAYNPEDALLDQDNDGASNGYEINHNTLPDTADSFNAINLLEYFPLGNIDYFYVANNQFIRISIEPTNKIAQFKMHFSNQTEWVIEKRASGIYLLSYREDDSEMPLVFTNTPIFPGTLTPGQAVKFTGSVRRDGSDEIQETTTQIYLKDVGETAWQGKVYPSITLVENGNETIYLKGVGAMTKFNIDLDSVNLNTLAPAEIIAPESSSKSSGGHISIAFLLSLFLFTASRKKLKLRLR